MGGKNTNNATRRAILRERREKRQKQAAKKAQKAQQDVDGKTDMTEDGTAIAPPPPPSSPAAATITGTSATAPVAAKGSKVRPPLILTGGGFLKAARGRCKRL
jgi:hypothetical protein